jgi:hypothetical protein
MIPEYYIQQWREYAPWNEPYMVEQDLIICRALVCIFSDEFLASQLAFRGGTALHKLYLSPQPRYSEDIDLVQITPGPIKPHFCQKQLICYISAHYHKIAAIFCTKKYHRRINLSVCGIFSCNFMGSD